MPYTLPTFILIFIVTTAFNPTYSSSVTGSTKTINLYRFDSCSVKNSSKEYIKANFRLHKFNGKLVLSGNITFPFNFDNSFTSGAAGSKWMGSSWMKQVSWEGNGCEYLNKFGKRLWIRFLRALRPQVNTNCLINKGFYTFDNIYAKSADLEIPSMIYGRIKTHVTFYKARDVVFCAEAEAYALK